MSCWDFGMATAGAAPWCPGLTSPALRGFSTSILSWERPQHLVYSLPSLAKIPPKAEQG